MVSLTERRQALADELQDIFEPLARLEVEVCDDAIYKQFRCLEPQLVSCIDGHSDVSNVDQGFLVAKVHGEPASVVSFVVASNTQRKMRANLYGRIDLVITADSFRLLGVGRVLTLAALTQMLDVYRDSLYSISCLAAHVAMEKILEQVGFCGFVRAGKQFKQEELKLEGVDISILRGKLLEGTREAANASSYRIRQQNP